MLVIGLRTISTTPTLFNAANGLSTNEDATTKKSFKSSKDKTRRRISGFHAWLDVRRCVTSVIGL